MKYEDAIKRIGVDVKETLARFSGNEALMKKFLLKFPQDKSCTDLKQALKAQDFPTVQKAAHTLKGVAGNLGLKELYTQAAAISDALKQGDVDYAKEHGGAVVALAQEIADILQSVQ